MEVLDPSAQPPDFLKPSWTFEPIPGKVAVDLFYFTFCMTSDLEAQRVREVVAGFGDRVMLREYCADEREVFLRHQQPRGIFVNGTEISWGYEAPKDGIRKAIAEALGTL